MNNEELVDKYIKYLELEKNFSNNTLINYKSDLEQFLIFLKANNKSLLTIDRLVGRMYLAKLREDNYKKTSLGRKIATLKSFFKFLVIEGVIEKNNFLYIRSPKQDKKIPVFLDKDEAFSLIELPLHDTVMHLRDSSIFEVLYATGVRVSELVGMKNKDIDFIGETIQVRGKGNKERLVPIGIKSLNVLKRYIDKRAEYATIKNLDITKSNLFINARGGSLTARSVRRILDKYLKMLSIKKHVSPHTLRHTFATHLINAGCDLKSVQEMLGHVNLSTTQIYTHVEIDRLKKDYLKAHPHSR